MSARCICAVCGKRLGSPQARHQHERAKHTEGGQLRVARAAEARDESLADRVIEASQLRAMGMPIDDDIASAFADYL